MGGEREIVNNNRLVEMDDIQLVVTTNYEAKKYDILYVGQGGNTLLKFRDRGGVVKTSAQLQSIPTGKFIPVKNFISLETATGTNVLKVVGGWLF